MLKKLIKVIFVVILLLFFYYEYKYFTFDFMYKGDLKDGKPVVSPNGDYSAQIYYENYGGAAGGVNLIVNIINQKSNKEQTIYFSDAKGNVILNWKDPNVLSVTNYDQFENRNVDLIVGKEIYDENGGACQHYKIKKQYVCKDKDSI
ncbi:DUF5412 family protein [Lysinibacillus sp. NPDC097195]|uniref:DUF5412 family protein n=1 Tax=Lysinibacillus sp. NPDC097195 TaxID=3364141 RepID=UPI0037F51129